MPCRADLHSSARHLQAVADRRQRKLVSHPQDSNARLPDHRLPECKHPTFYDTDLKIQYWVLEAKVKAIRTTYMKGELVQPSCSMPSWTKSVLFLRITLRHAPLTLQSQALPEGCLSVGHKLRPGRRGGSGQNIDRQDTSKTSKVNQM